MKYQRETLGTRTQSEVARILRMSPQHVAQVEKRALKKCRIAMGILKKNQPRPDDWKI